MTTPLKALLTAAAAGGAAVFFWRRAAPVPSASRSDLPRKQASPTSSDGAVPEEVEASELPAAARALLLDELRAQF